MMKKKLYIWHEMPWVGGLSFDGKSKLLAVLGALAVATVMLSGCALVDEATADCPPAVSYDVPNGHPVGFTTVRGDGPGAVTTRTPEGQQTVATLRADGFGVFACHHGNHPYASSNVSANFMWNQLVTWDELREVWTYEPLKYWPNGEGDEQHKEYVSFFAYGPYAEASQSGCITDFSNNTDTGDPWLVYQLGGTRDDWQSSQVDLLYAVAKDQQRESPTARIPFNFHHALAGVGDRLTLSCSAILQDRMKEAAKVAGRRIRLMLNRLTLNYTLLRKGRLVLNSSDGPNWQAVESEDPMVHRILTVVPSGRQLAYATSSYCGAAAKTFPESGSSDDGLGIFYIPLEVTNHPQTLSITAAYSVEDDGGTVLYEGAAGTVIELAGSASSAQNLRVTLGDNLPLEGVQDQSVFIRILDIAGQTYTGSPIEPAVTVVSSDGRVLTEGTDYTLAFTGNTDAGTASVTATGTGDYQGGLASRTFAIVQAVGAINFSATVHTISASGAGLIVTNTGDGTVTYTSSNPAVAMVDEEGSLTKVAAGTCVITATVTDSDNYTYPVKTASYYLTVN